VNYAELYDALEIAEDTDNLEYREAVLLHLQEVFKHEPQTPVDVRWYATGLPDEDKALQDRLLTPFKKHG